MTEVYDIMERIKETQVVAVMRGDFRADRALEVADVLLKEGISIFEMTTNSTEPIKAMQVLKRVYGRRAYVGMGTVLDVKTAKQVMDAGADFVVSPAFDPEVVQTVTRAGKMMIPGVTTPSEAVAAWDMGVPILKLFPVGVLGVQYFKTMFGPLNHMTFMCNGGITDANAPAFVKAGAVGVGVAGWLTGSGDTDTAHIQERARILNAALRGEQPPVQV